MSNKLTWENVYMFPLELDEYDDDKIMTSDYRQAFDFIAEDFVDIFGVQHNRLTKETRYEIVSIINGEEGATLTNKKLKKFTRNNDQILIGDVIMGSVRGWGYLIGLLNLNDKYASNIQDKFLDYIVKQLNNATKKKK